MCKATDDFLRAINHLDEYDQVAIAAAAARLPPAHSWYREVCVLQYEKMGLLEHTAALKAADIQRNRRR